MTAPICIRCGEAIPDGISAEPVMTGRKAGEDIRLLGMRAQHTASSDGEGCELIPDTYIDGHLRWMLSAAEVNPFPAYRRFSRG